MEFRRIKLKHRWLAVALAVGVPCLGLAQPVASPEQPIQFSAPAGGNAAAGSPALINQPALLPSFSGSPQSPSSVFNFSAPETMDPLPLPQVFPPSQQQRDAAAAKKNWMLMTPEQILGVQTPEQILGTSERDATGQEKQSTPMEQYLDRQNAAYAPATNGYAPANALRQMNIFDSQNALPTENLQNVPAARPMETKSIWSQLLNSPAAPDTTGQAASEGSIWQQLMGTAPTAPVDSGPSPAQVADMERFQQLLGTAAPPPVSPASMPVAAAPANPFYAPPNTVVDPILGELKVNPAGASFAPLSSGVGVPAGVPALPGITTPQSEASLPTTTSAAQVQNPPWVITGPGLFAPPQRKF